MFNKETKKILNRVFKRKRFTKQFENEIKGMDIVDLGKKVNALGYQLSIKFVDRNNK